MQKHDIFDNSKNITNEWLNDVQEELVNIVESEKNVLQRENKNQVNESIASKIKKENEFKLFSTKINNEEKNISNQIESNYLNITKAYDSIKKEISVMFSTKLTEKLTLPTIDFSSKLTATTNSFPIPLISKNVTDLEDVIKKEKEINAHIKSKSAIHISQYEKETNQILTKKIEEKLANYKPNRFYLQISNSWLIDSDNNNFKYVTVEDYLTKDSSNTSRAIKIVNFLYPIEFLNPDDEKRCIGYEKLSNIKETVNKIKNKNINDIEFDILTLKKVEIKNEEY